ncbi:uncharacterized protein LOC110710799 [Chenopodium quinoa]|uniref:uncharacterized protein LOC110710799 n=1 Tax=Chenopodium quinoa TaxID=63459 RepID=UPI000B78C58B|nr:uncharacterized protein LOC110710799 [Chenopodium quinoa]
MVNAKLQLFCTHCNRSGRDYDACLLVHGLPEWWLEKYGRSSSLATTLPRAAAPSPSSQSAATTPILGEVFDKYDVANFSSNHSAATTPILGGVFDKYTVATSPSKQSAATTPIVGGGDKFAPKSRKCVFVGYPHGKKGWKVYDLETGDIFVSRDVKFHEDEFPFMHNEESNDPHVGVEMVGGGVDVDFLDDLNQVLEIGEVSTVHGSNESSPQPPSPSATAVVLVSAASSGTAAALGSVAAGSMLRGSPTAANTDRSHPANSSASATEVVDTVVEPRNFKEAMKDEGWREAMQKEISTLENNHTWVMEKLPPGKKALGCRWVYKVKLNSDGSIERLKACLVIFGNHQVEGIDYNETFAPVAKMVTVRAFLAVAAAKNWELHQMEVYMTPLPGFHGSKPGLFGLLRASHAGTPIEQNYTLAKLESPLISDPEMYRRLVGHLIYLYFTRPDLAYAVHILSQFMQQPRQDHWEAVLRTVRYLKGCPGWCDSDWASCPLTRRSISDWLVFLGASPISWKIKKQDTVAKSSAEAEFRSMSKTTNELKWLKDGIIIPSYVKTTDQLADIFTKASNKQQFLYLLGKLGICNLHAPT